MATKIIHGIDGNDHALPDSAVAQFLGKTVRIKRGCSGEGFRFVVEEVSLGFAGAGRVEVTVRGGGHGFVATSDVEVCR